MKIDLDNLERRARAVRYEEWIANADPAAVMTMACDLIAGFDRTPWSPDEDDTNAEHIAANSPPVTLALIARIRELESGLRDAIACHEGVREQPVGRSAPWHALIEKGVVLP